MRVYILRHGLTRGNLEKRYIGLTGEPLCPEGMEALAGLGTSGYAGPVYVSPRRRALKTAKMLFPKAVLVPKNNLSEMDFGVFEGKNWQEMSDFAPYRAWVDGGCLEKCPGGEDRETFIRRVCGTFEEILAGHDPVLPLVMVAHGGTAMALLYRYADEKRDYWDWKCGAGEGFACRWDGRALRDCEALPGGEILRRIDAGEDI